MNWFGAFITTLVWFILMCIGSVLIWPLPEGEKLFDARTFIIVSCLLNILIEVKQSRK